MADKKFYWLKLKRDFFKRHDIRIIEEMQNGKDYVLFYLKLLLESIDHEGELRFSDTIPYNEQMLSVITNTNIDIVRSAIKLLRDLNMIDIFDDSTIYMTEVQKLIGSETASAERKRRSRATQRAALPESVTMSQCGHNVSQKSHIEIEKELDIEKEIELDTHTSAPARVSAQSIIDLFNSLCPSLPSVETLNDARQTKIDALLGTYSIDQFKRCFENAESSSFLKGGGDKGWQASFDWIIDENNFPKVLEGNYANKARYSKKPRYGNFDPDEAYQAAIDRSYGKEQPKTAQDDPIIRERAEALQAELQRG